MTPDEHRAEAETLAQQHDAQPNAIPEHHIALAVYAVAHALLAQQPPAGTKAQPPPRPVTWAGFASLLVLCATLVAVAWLVTR